MKSFVQRDHRLACAYGRSPSTPVTPRWQARSAESDAAGTISTDSSPATRKGAPEPVAPIVNIEFPKRGLFSIADPNAEVYSKAGERFDPAKKGGRWKPEFIWQTNWQEQLKRQEDLERQQAEYKRRKESGEVDAVTGPGVVSFARLGTLDDVNFDLSDQLRAAREKAEQQQKAAAAAATAAAAADGVAADANGSSSSRAVSKQQQPPRRQRGAGASPSYQFKDLPTKSEARRFQRVTRSAGVGTVASISAVGSISPEEAAARAAAAALEKQRYDKLKTEFQAFTVLLGAVGTVTCYYCYTKDVAISYALGASSGLTYLRLLTRTVDSVGGASVKSTLGQPRLLIPVLLALTYNRWNLLYADHFGYHLDFYGMLVGFFTYKLAVIGRQGWELFSEIGGGSKGAAASSSSSSSGGEDGDAMSLDRIFIQKALRE